MQMPGMNGCEVCDQIKQNAETAEIPVIFLSGRSSVRERMLGYEVGGDDSIVKPCEPEELKAKIGILLKFADQQAGLRDAFKEAHQTAIVAMAGNSELGQALSFAQQSFLYSFLQCARRTVLRSATRFQAQLLSAIPYQTGRPVFRQMAKLSPWKKELMVLLRSDQRIHDFGIRTQFNFPRVALLVKTCRSMIRDRYGRYKDLFPFMLEAADAKLRQLDARQALLQQTKSLLMSFMSIQTIYE